jgi:hypothetical protein
MNYNVKNRIYKPALNSTKWTVSKLKEERERENYNNRIKQNLNYTETETTELKTCDNNRCKRYIRKITATT